MQRNFSPRRNIRLYTHTLEVKTSTKMVTNNFQNTSTENILRGSQVTNTLRLCTKSLYDNSDVEAHENETVRSCSTSNA